MTATVRTAVLRPDSRRAAGLGHLRRCRALADRLADAGWQVRIAVEAGFLPSADGIDLNLGEAPVTTDEAAHAQLLRERLDGQSLDLLVVDHYGLGHVFESALRTVARRILVIDDLADRAHDCDVLVDQNDPHSARYDGLVPHGCRRLLGPHYALIGVAYGRAIPMRKDARAAAHRILVTFGGRDAENLTAQTIVALAQVDATLDVVLGPQNDHGADIAARVSALGACARLHVAPADLAALMTDADLAVSAAGSTAYELAAMGVPMILIEAAANQRPVLDSVVGAGAAVRAAAGAAQIAAAFAALMEDPAALRRMSQAGPRLIDGRGAERVIAEIGIALKARAEAGS